MYVKGNRITNLYPCEDQSFVIVSGRFLESRPFFFLNLVCATLNNLKQHSKLLMCASLWHQFRCVLPHTTKKLTQFWHYVYTRRQHHILRLRVLSQKTNSHPKLQMIMAHPGCHLCSNWLYIDLEVPMTSSSS